MSDWPDPTADERTMLLAFLDMYRGTLIRKIEGLDEDQARWKPSEQANSLINLIVHLTGVEKRWFTGTMAGEPLTYDREAEFGAVGVTVNEAIAQYRSVCERSNAIAKTFDSMDARCLLPERQDLKVRFVLVHMIEETARHAGHADITRELIDGAVGE